MQNYRRMVNNSDYKIKGVNQGIGCLIGANGEKEYLQLSDNAKMELEKLKEELDLSGIPDTLVSSIHPITVMGIESFKQNFYSLTEFEDFVFEWIKKEKEDMFNKFEKEFVKEDIVNSVKWDKFKKNELGRRR